MNRLALLLVVLLSTVSAIADEHFRILSISPSSAPISGGTQVTIQLNEFPECPILPYGPTVLFGNLVASVVTVDGTTFTATAPSHAVGVVDITIETCGAGPIVAARSFTYFDPALSLDPDDYERVLFPVMFQGPGAFGSQWRTDVAAHNRSEQSIEAARSVFEGNPMCPAICGCSARNDLQPRETNHVCVGGFSNPAGLLFYPPKAQSDDVAYSSRVVDTTRLASNLGTEVPVVREREFRTGMIVLPEVPVDSRYRVSLRVYNPDQLDGAQVRMRVSSRTQSHPVIDTTLTMSYDIVNVVFDPFPTIPAFKLIGDLAGAYPDLASVEGEVQIELTPITEGMRFWAFASITNNETQQVTVATPQ